MKKILFILSIVWGSTMPAQAQDQVPEVSKAPLAAMERLAPLAGKWITTAKYSADDGKTWQQGQPEETHLTFRQKGMFLHEVPQNIDKPGFHTEMYLGYDQYRKVYRLIAADDTWGLPDIYEGTIENDKLVVTNLKSETFFPIDADTWRGFRLTLDLKSDTRTMIVDKTDDMGKSWQPNFRITYVKQ